MRATYRAESRKEYGRETDTGNLGNEDLTVGCLMRIADATEVMARRYQDLIDDRDRYKRWYEEERATLHLTIRRLNATKGVVTKLRKQREALRNADGH